MAREDLIRLIRKGRRAETRGKALTGFIGRQIALLLNALFGGWMLMLTVGIVHSEWIPQVPTIGYWWATAIVALMGGVFSRVPPVKTEAAS
jgi:hypothetical protein